MLPHFSVRTKAPYIWLMLIEISVASILLKEYNNSVGAGLRKDCRRLKTNKIKVEIHHEKIRYHHSGSRGQRGLFVL